MNGYLPGKMGRKEGVGVECGVWCVGGQCMTHVCEWFLVLGSVLSERFIRQHVTCCLMKHIVIDAF